MGISRAYVPSRALLRALSRPLPSRCPLARPLPAQFIRSKRTKGAKLKAAIAKQTAGFRPDFTREDFEKELAEVEAQMEKQKSASDDNSERDTYLTDEELENPKLPAIRWYEQDPDGTQRLVRETVTPEDRKRERDMLKMIEESWANPDYDDATLNRALLDDLAKDPNFSDLAEGLMEIKKSIMSKEDIRAAEEQAAKDAEVESKEMEKDMHTHAQQLLQDLIDDPEIGDAKEELLHLKTRLSGIDDIEDPAFQAELDKTMAKLNNDKRFEKFIAAKADEAADPKVDTEWAKWEKDMEALLEDDDDDDDPFDVETPEGIQKVEKLMAEMRDMLKTISGDPKLQAEIDTLLDDKPPAEPDVDENELIEKLNIMAQADSQGYEPLRGAAGNEHISPSTTLEKRIASATSRSAEKEESDGYEALSDDLKAKVDQLIQDPKIVEKLMFVQNLIAEEQEKAAQLVAIDHETAPDPETLPPSRTATLKERTEMARRDPEHMAAMARLRVSLLPPFNIAPALRHFNQSIELAYVGANDDVRRILWRAYIKARSLPSFLNSLSDDAWDIMYYSQAVKWQSNQNREHHLHVVLGDLKSLGRDGPPTHPETLVKEGNGIMSET